MKRIISLLILSVVLLPATAGAQGSTERESIFCSNQAERQAAIADMFATRTEAYHKAIQIQSDNQLSRRTKLDEELAGERATADIARSDSYNLIRAKQTTDEAKAQVDVYAAEVDAAVAIRRTEYDAARTVFHETIDTLVSNRNSDMQTAAGIFQQSAVTTMQTATTQCTSTRTDRAALRQQTITEMRTARLKYAERLRLRQDFRAELRSAVNVRNEAYKAATTRFQQVMQAIREKHADIKD